MISNQDAPTGSDLNRSTTFCTFFFSFRNNFCFFEEMARALESAQARECQVFKGLLLFWEDYPGVPLLAVGGPLHSPPSVGLSRRGNSLPAQAFFAWTTPREKRIGCVSCLPVGAGVWISKDLSVCGGK